MNERSRILLVDDEAENLRALERTLRTRFDVFACSAPSEALAELRRTDFAVIVSDQRMPERKGTEWLAEAAALRPLVTRVLLTAYTETQDLLEAINRAEIYRYLTKPWDNDELLSTIDQAAEYHRLRRQNAELVRALEGRNRLLEEKERELLALNQNLEKLVQERTTELQRANERLSELAMTDPLTRVLNRRAFFQKLNEEIERARRYGRPLTLAMIDVDHFKTFNDMEGHVKGDEALRKIASLFSSNLRKTDVLGRYGGEEFIVLMPETKLTGAQEICNRLRNAVEVTRFQGKAGDAFLSVSIGLAALPEPDDTTPERLVQVADGALYEAKEAGRNRVMVAK